MAEYPISAAGTLPSPLYAGMADSGAAANGAIAGGKLRPGAIDQSQFQQMLAAQAQQQQQVTSGAPVRGLTLADYRKLAGTQTTAASNAAPTQFQQRVTPQPANPDPAPAATAAAPAAGDGIPTLSLEQFAALTGLQLQQETSAEVPNSAASGVPLATGSVETIPEPDPLASEEPVTQTADAATPAEATDGVPVSPGETPKSPETDPKNSRVVMLDSYPDREEQKSLAAQGKTWRLKETPGARELFLGPDGEFGWDDFVDIINPLQHIPVVAQIYRAVTGDQAYGLSNFVGALPFGPVSVASAIADTVVRAQTGRDAGTDMAARVLGIDNRTPEEADLHLATGDTTQMAEAATGGAEGQVQVAALPTTASAWTRDGAGVGRD